jgi:hypothetical protein
MDEIEKSAGMLWRYLIAKVRLGINNNDIPRRQRASSMS